MKFNLEKTKTFTDTIKETLNIELSEDYHNQKVTLMVNGYHVFEINKKGECRLVGCAFGSGLETDKQGRVKLEE